MTGQLFWHPRLAEGCDRINARSAEANRAAEWAAAIDRCKQIIDDPRGYSDAQLREVCGFYMAYGDGGVHYLRADQLLFAIERRRQVKVNEAKCRAALARIDDRDEKARLALARKGLGLFTVIYMLVFAGIVVAVGFGWVTW